jgi:hypothetical protein
MPQPVSALLVELELQRLKEPPYYKVLFGLDSAVEHDLLPDQVIRVRPLDPLGDAYEIVTGVEQFRAALGQGAQTITAVVKEMAEEEARRYATDQFLRSAAFSKKSLLQLLVIAKDNEGCGGHWDVERLTKFLKIKKSTYTHAWSSVSFVCDLLRSSDPETAHLGLTELVALAVRKNFLPAFTELYVGRMSVDRFYREVYRDSELAKRRSQQQREAKSRRQLQREPSAPEAHDSGVGGKSTSPTAAKYPQGLIAEAVLKFAEASSQKRGGDGTPDNDGAQTIGRQLLTLLDSHPDLEAEIRQVCQLVLKHLDNRGKLSRRKLARTIQPAPHGHDRQLSFDLQTTTAGRRTARRYDDGNHTG